MLHILFFCKLLQLVALTIILVSLAYNMVYKSLSIILGRLFIYLYIKQHLDQKVNLEELRTSSTPNLTESYGLLCILRILSAIYHLSKT